MIGTKSVVCVIPARLRSTRFPRKVLSVLKGKPLLQWVWERARSVALFDRVLFAVDASETLDLVKGFQAEALMTSEHCLVGTERIVELVCRKEINADIIVNWQADEPFVAEKMIHELLQSSERDGCDIWTLKKRIHKQEEINSPHTVKVVCDATDHALYFSRSPIPYYRDAAPGCVKNYFKHVGMYAYSKEALQKISSLQPSDLELAEQLEQLRWLSNGLKIAVHETKSEVFGIDLPEHLAQAEALLNKIVVS